MAYEVFSGERQTKKTDIWALGILLYEIYHSYAPFRGRGIGEIIGKLNDVERFLVFDEMVCGEDVRELIVMILKKDCEKRPSAEEILEHRIFDEFKNEKIFKNGNFVKNDKILKNEIKKDIFVKNKKSMNFVKKKTEQVIIFNREEVKILIDNDMKKKNSNENTRDSYNEDFKEKNERVKNKIDLKSSNFTNIYEKKKLDDEKKETFCNFIKNYDEKCEKVKKYRYSYQKVNLNYSDHKKKNKNYEKLNFLENKKNEKNEKNEKIDKIGENLENEKIVKKIYENYITKKNEKKSLSIEPKRKIRLTVDSKVDNFSKLGNLEKKKNNFSNEKKICSQRKVYSLSVKSKRNYDFLNLVKKNENSKFQIFSEKKKIEEKKKNFENEKK